jgi:hypothetical protein
MQLTVSTLYAAHIAVRLTVAISATNQREPMEVESRRPVMC